MLKKLSQIIENEMKIYDDPKEGAKKTLVLLLWNVSGHSFLSRQDSLYSIINNMEYVQNHDKKSWELKRLTRDCIAIIYHSPEKLDGQDLI